ncbi:MAG: putative rane protein [Mucilaginibacter sp.]|nr:putative rane protein [Mucilaginibacter sp.]
MSITGRLLRYFAFFWILILSLGTFVQYLNFKHDTVFLSFKQAAIKTGWYMPAFYCHIFGSSIILIAGFFQFSKKVYNNRPLHKALGKLYIFGVLFFAAPGAYVMTLFINRGKGVFASFLIQNTLWVAFTLSAFLLIKNSKVNAHVKMMRRSYALAFAAVTLRFYIWLFTVLGNGVNFENNYLIIAFLSWVPNLLLVELINRYDKAPYQAI